MYPPSFSALDELRDHLENPDNLTEMKYLLLEQKYLELLSQKNRIDALKVGIETVMKHDYVLNRASQVSSHFTNYVVVIGNSNITVIERTSLVSWFCFDVVVDTNLRASQVCKRKQ
jgi:hypothetical protein